MSIFSSSTMRSMRYFAPSGSTTGCQWRFAGTGPVHTCGPSARARCANSSARPFVTRRYLPSSRALVQSMMSTMPFVKRPPRDPYRSTSATFAPVRAAAIAAAKPAGPPPTTTTSVVWKIGISRAGWRILPSFSTQLGPSVIVCSSGKMFLPNQTLSGSPQLPGGRVAGGPRLDGLVAERGAARQGRAAEAQPLQKLTLCDLHLFLLVRVGTFYHIAAHGARDTRGPIFRAHSREAGSGALRRVRIVISGRFRN